jgi:hypothetical protein
MPELVRRIVDYYRLSGDFRQEQLFSDWSSLVGDKVGARTRPDTIVDRVLIVEVASSAWLHELRLIRPKIVSDLLDTSRMEIGKVELSRASIDVAQTVRAALARLETVARSRSITLEFEAMEGLPAVSADPRRIE